MEVNIKGVPVYIGIPVYGSMPYHTAHSLALTMQACGANGIPAELGMHNRGIVHWARNMVLDGFLKSDKQKLFWIDSDMVWNVGDFFKFLAMSTVRDVVCAAYPAKQEGPLDFQIGGSGVVQDCDTLGLLEIWGTGLGFTIMDRSICEQLADNAPKARDGDRHYARVFRADDIVDGRMRGEDIGFFADIRGLGHKVWLDPTIELGHAGQKVWRGRALDSLQRIED